MMRGNLIWVVGLSGSNVEFMLDESGEWEVVDGGRITQRQNDGWYQNELEKFRKNFNSQQPTKSEDNLPEFQIQEFRNKDDHKIIYKHDSQLKGKYVAEDGCAPFFEVKNFLSMPEYEIFKVKRTSDSQEFSIGEETNYGTIGLFFIKDGKMMIQQDKTIGKGFGGVPLSVLTKKKEKEVLFTTEDGVEVIKSDAIFGVDEDFKIKEGWAWNFITDDRCKDMYKIFSTKEKAEEYILLNKPVLSLKDIDDLVDDENAWEKAKQIAKEKMKA